jgi:SAM-dependent methyltransferase
MKDNILAKIWAPAKFRKIFSLVKPDRKLRVLDVGAGCNSCIVTRKWFGEIEYHGIDRIDSGYYNDFRKDYEIMDKFFNINLEASDLSEVPNDYYDVIIFTHCIEHIRPGSFVVEQLSKKLRTAGVMYIEFPGPKSLGLPFDINFSIDPTHIMMYDFRQVAQFARNSGLCIVQAGTRRSMREIIFISPFGIMLCLYSYLRGKGLSGRGLLDLTGYSDYVLCQKRNIVEKDGKFYWMIVHPENAP